MAKEEKKSFEGQLKRLEEIVEILDEGEAPLEEMLELYEEGMLLAKECRAFLDKTEQKIIDISGNSEVPV